MLGKSSLFTQAPLTDANPPIRIKFLGFNALLLAAHVSCDTAIFDFFLEKGCDPTELDNRGYVDIPIDPSRDLRETDHGLDTIYIMSPVPRRLRIVASSLAIS